MNERTGKGGKAMKRDRPLWKGLVVTVLLLSFVCLAGCTKKAALKEEAIVPQAQQQAVEAQKKPMDDQAARERMQKEQALREQVLREQTLREQALRKKAAEDAAKKNAQEAAEKVRQEAAAKQAAILKELLIPDIHFDFDKYNLTPADQAMLKTAAPAYLNYVTYRIAIEGHCDERGTVEYNLALGQKRADVAAQYLIDLGIAKERIRTITYGKERPLDPGHNEAAWATNRRAHFLATEPAK
jgi:peptidoglycan-associated lipoprotein